MKCDNESSVDHPDRRHCQVLWYNYVGNIINEKREGFGETITRQLRFRGNWTNDLREGDGEMILYENAFDNMAYLKGKWVSDKLSGDDILLINLHRSMYWFDYMRHGFGFTQHVKNSHLAWYWVEYYGSAKDYLADGVGTLTLKRTRDLSLFDGKTVKIFTEEFLENSETIFSVSEGEFHEGIMAVTNDTTVKPTINLELFGNQTTITIEEYNDSWSAQTLGHSGSAKLTLHTIDSLHLLCEPFLNNSIVVDTVNLVHEPHSFNSSQLSLFNNWAKEKPFVQSYTWNGRRLNSTLDIDSVLSTENQQCAQVTQYCLRRLGTEIERVLRTIQRTELFWLAAKFRIVQENLDFAKLLIAKPIING